MVAACRNFWVLLIGLAPLIACSQVSQDPGDEGVPIVQLLSKRLADSVVKLESDIERCSKLENENGTISLDPTILESASREQLLTGIGHLHFHNRFECEKQARRAAAFDIGTMQSVTGSTLSPQELQSINRSLVYPSEQQLEYEIRYRQLPESVRSTLETTIGTGPFLLMETLEANNLVTDGP